MIIHTGGGGWGEGFALPPGQGSQGERYMRISLCAPVEVFEKALNKILAAKRLGKNVEGVLFDERSEEFYAIDLHFSLVTFFWGKPKESNEKTRFARIYFLCFRVSTVPVELAILAIYMQIAFEQGHRSPSPRELALFYGSGRAKPSPHSPPPARMSNESVGVPGGTDTKNFCAILARKVFRDF